MASTTSKAGTRSAQSKTSSADADLLTAEISRKRALLAELASLGNASALRMVRRYDIQLIAIKAVRHG